MNIHKNASTTPRSRALMVHRVMHEHWPVSAVAIALGVSERTVYKWLARLGSGMAGADPLDTIQEELAFLYSPRSSIQARIVTKAYGSFS